MTTDITIIDAGPSLNFFSIGRAGLLLGVLESISARIALPEDVDDEIRRKAGGVPRFSKSAGALDWALKSDRLLRLDSRSGQDIELDKNVARIVGVPFERRPQRGKDLGEMMVIAHAKTLQGQGKNVIVLIDDGGGQQLAANHQVAYITTIRILQVAARLGLIQNWGEMRELYMKMEPLDDGLPTVGSPEVQRQLRDKSIYRNAPG